MTWVYVAVGAGLGAPLRFLLSRWLDRPVGLPWGTVLVNVVGSFLLGWFTALTLADHAMALLGVGFCGGFTTYSSFAVQAAERGPRHGGMTAVLTVPVALAACALGHVAGDLLLQLLG